MLTVVVGLITVILVGWLFLYMRAQKPVTNSQNLIQLNRYEEAAAQPATDSAAHLHRAEALKLMGRFDEALMEYRLSDDPAASEGIALTLAHIPRDLEEARRLMEQTIAAYPQILEFQALGLAYILLRSGKREDALRLFDDNVVLLQTRFKDDYTDPDPLLAETLYMFSVMTDAAGDKLRAAQLRAQASAWARGSVWSDSRTMP